MSRQRENYENAIAKQAESWEEFCPVCGEELYIGDPPGAGAYCDNPSCPECNPETLEDWDDRDDDY